MNHIGAAAKVMTTTQIRLLVITVSFFFLGVHVASSSTEAEFKKLYDYYFPKHGEGVTTSVYRKSFDAELFGSTRRFNSDRERHLYYAFHGDAAAFHAFLHNADREVNGAQGEEWDYECLVLLLKLGDEHFAELLAREDHATREGVAAALEPLVNWEKHSFPRTRALYSFRYTQPPRPEERVVVAIATKGLGSNEAGSLEVALKRESRFSRVEIVSSGRLGEPEVITAPKTMPKRDFADLQRMLKRELAGNKSVTFENVMER